MKKNILLAGASGLVGSFMLKKLLEEQNNNVIVLVRKTLGLKHKNLTEVIVNFEDLKSLSLNCEIDEFYCALGTTIKKAKTKENFYKVDFIYALECAKLALRHSAKSIALISAIEANKNSFFFYGRVKGKLEEAIQEQNWQNIVFVRPSLILGKRNEYRFLEELGKKILILLNPILQLVAPKLRPVQAEEIAERTIKEMQKNNQTRKRVIYF